MNNKRHFTHNLSSVKFSLNPLLPIFEHSADTPGCSFVDFTLVCPLSVVEITPFSSESETGHSESPGSKMPNVVLNDIVYLITKRFHQSRMSGIVGGRKTCHSEDIYVWISPRSQARPFLSQLSSRPQPQLSLSCLFIAAQVYFKVGCKLFLYFLIH